MNRVEIKKKVNRYDQGLNMVKPEAKAEILPPVRSIPQVVDPYASNMPETIQIVAHHKSDDAGRTQALVRKAREITMVVGLLTGAVMYAFTLYPQAWGGFAVFVLWCVFALTEWLAAFIILAVLDYKETPAAQNRYQMKNMMRMAWREQTHRLRAMYPDQEVKD